MRDLPMIVTYRRLVDLGLTRRQFEGLVETGLYERIAPGQFLRAGSTDDVTAAWIAIAAKRPEATLCLLSALSNHDLTDEIPRSANIAIPRGAKPVAVKFAEISWHQFDPETFNIGRGDYTLPEGHRIGLYSPERTIVDVFRLRHVWGSDLAIEALKRWLRMSGNSPSRLLSVAESFPHARSALHNAIEILLS